MNPKILVVGTAILFAALTHSSSAASTSTGSFSFTSIDVPGATATRALGLNNHGEVSGDYVDAGGVRRGYFLRRGEFTTFDPPGSIETRGLAINDRGDIGGTYLDSASVRHSYVLSHGDFRTFDFPGATGTFLQGMNNHGQIAGAYLDAAGVTHGFLLEAGSFATIDFPGAVATVAGGINDPGQVVGLYDDSAGLEHGFLMQNGNFTTIDFPSAFSLTDLFGISNNGVMVGFYDDSTGAIHGFELRDGNFITVDIPGASNTDPTRVNSPGQLVGFYDDLTGRHGFLATPSAVVATTPAPQAPTSKEQCNDDGYKGFGPPAGPFKNQGQCVSYVEHHSHGMFTPVLTRLSTDTLTNSTSQHATEVEPDTFAFGSTIVSAFQVGRIITGAAADIGFATSSDGGATWTSGLLPGITIFQGGTSFNAAGDPVVAYDAAHAQWIIACLGVQEDESGNPTAEQVLVSRSADGLSWGDPIAVNPVGGYDKDWIVCDNTSSSPFYGHCYVQWRDKGLMTTSTSTDGGLTWQAPLHTADMVNGFGGQPLVQPNGTVISPMVKLLVTDMLSFTSTDGGASWTASTEISPITDHTVAGNLRSGQVPSAEIDALGTVYVVWANCRFRTNCSSNDLVLSKSSDGVTWTSPARIPIDPVNSTVDHFIPGLAVDRTTSGNTAHLTLTYYYYPVSDCGTLCDLFVGFVSSQDGGQTWSAPVPLAGPMKTTWLASTGGNVAPGYFVGDYISGSYVNGNPFAVFAVAAPNSGTVFDEAMYTTAQPMIPPPGALYYSSNGETPVPDAKSDHAPRDPYLEHGQSPF
jgi:probable HAF family extracellular repeat protein